ncbi:MAG TPA: DUF929 family protein [Acidimicrobiales bacterium]|nr:DUF929 family protein [Acidimicrobiales bacterium]
MSQVQPGKGSGQRPPSGTRRPPSGRPKPGQGKPGQGQGGGGRPRQGGQQGPGKGAGRRPGTQVTSAPPRRFSPSTLAFASIAVVVLVVVALIVVKITGGSSTPANTGPIDTSAPAALVHQVTNLPDSVYQAVGVPSSIQAPPKVDKGQPPLTANGKPEALYIGAEFCPYCAAERWAIVTAFSRFGTFSGLKETTSTPYDVYPQTATFSFYGATYTSSLLQFTMIEHETNDTHGQGTRTTLMALTNAQSNLWTKYANHFGVQTGYPFIDFNNKVFVLGPAYSPQILSGLDQNGIAAKLSNPTDPITQAVIGEANYITAAICDMTGQQPGPVCTAKATTDAAKALGL